MEIRSYPLADEVDFLSIRDTRFNTARLTAAMFLPLREETAAMYGILPDLLTRCSAAFPDVMQLSRRLSRLYGATLISGVSRIGEHQMLTLTVRCIDDRFALQGEAIAKEAAELLLSLLFHPHLSEDGYFDLEDFEQEKRCLCERIAAEINDKRAYAHQRGDRLLAGDDPYGVSAIGTAKTAAALDRETVTRAWQAMLKTAKFQWLYVSGDDGEAVKDQIKAAFVGRERAVDFGQTDPSFVPLPSPRRETERMSVNQAKLVMGFRLTAHEPDQKAVAAARLMTALFGGGPQSLLFRHVREEMSLCYYCQARFDRYKGVLTVDSGVAPADIKRAETAILEQLDRVARGDFSDETLEASRQSLIHRLRDHENLQSSIAGWYIGQSLCPRFLSPEEAIAQVNAVTREEICRMAQTVSPVSVYTLLPEGEDAP